MPVKVKNCKYIDYSPLVPDNPEPPICEKGHGFSSGCMDKNNCPDYEPDTAITLEELEEQLEASDAK